MSPSATGPGSWTLASTLAGREANRERNRLSRRGQSFGPSASTARAASAQPEANSKV
jgi:hypothetical protein